MLDFTISTMVVCMLASFAGATEATTKPATEDLIRKGIIAFRDGMISEDEAVRQKAFDQFMPKQSDFQAMLDLNPESCGLRTLAYCVMPNHRHLAIWPRADDDLAEFMRWLAVARGGDTPPSAQPGPKPSADESLAAYFLRFATATRSMPW